MKSILKKIVLLSLVAFVVALSSCDGDGGDGDKKDDTEVDPRDKFIGTWDVVEKVGSDPVYNYTAVVDYATNSAYIRIFNIYFLGPDNYVDALITSNTVTISNEETCDHIINGGGSYSNGQFTLNYTAKTTTDEVSVSATYSNN